MYRKASGPNSELRPPLVTYYISATKRVFGKKVFVAAKQFSKFIVFEDDLREKGISAKEYAYTVLLILEKRVRERGLGCVPVSMFLGDYALRCFMRVYESSTVRIDKVQEVDVLLADELTVAQMFIDRNRGSDRLVRLSTVVEELKPLLSEQWLACYKAGAARPELKAISQLALQYRISKPVSNYLDIVSALR